MINAKKARENTDTAVNKARETKVFKHAIARLEKDIKDASSRGGREICYNVCYFDIRKCSSLQRDEYATEADRAAIKEFMEKNGYEFFYHSVMNISGRWNSCFTCRW